MFRVITGYQASKDDPNHNPFWPCVKLVRGRKVVSLVDRGLGFSRFSDTLRATEVDSVRCYRFASVAETDQTVFLWDRQALARYEVEDDSLAQSSVEEAIKWLLDDTRP